tara:strand:- start:367 stop:789 length:423 start_codon:yes stop_codon:yes gene_type:complete
MTEDTNSPQESNEDSKYRTTKVKYGEKVTTGRIIGRDKVVVSEEQVAQLAQYHCTNREMADFFGVKLQTFVDNFRDIVDKNRIITKQRLRKAQLELALEKHDRVMLIWLGKNILGQMETPISSESEQVLPWLEDNNADIE